MDRKLQNELMKAKPFKYLSPGIAGDNVYSQQSLGYAG
jgi:hypothetical protein